jgi:hypothetical protein
LLAAKLADKSRECEEAKQRFGKLEGLARQLHQSWIDEQARSRRLEEELILKSQEKQRPENQESLRAIEKKYEELKLLIEKSAGGKKGFAKLELYEASLRASFELFSETFEAIVMSRDSKAAACEAIQQKIMAFFHAQSVMIAKLGYHERLVAVLKAYQSRHSTADKRRPLQPSSFEKRLSGGESYKENLPQNQSASQRIVYLDDDSITEQR